ncbi:MAG: hypothetical protein J6R17_03200 [Bacteroidales bacterium]|nr:hypothetical protein [Bacteroidales bacterium]
MKANFLLILLSLSFFFNLNAQSYNDLWNDVNENLENRLPETAETFLNKIEQKAISENNQKELLKSYLYRFKIFNQKDENPKKTSIQFAEENIGRLQEPEKSIFNLAIASLYENYLNDNFFRIDRIQTTNNSNELDIEFWDKATFENVIESYLNKSLENAESLKKTSAESYQEILSINDYNDEKIDYIYEPTLYDYVSHFVINYYKSYDNIKEKALNIYQELINFDKENNYTDAALYNKINKIELEYNISENLNEYLESLENLKNNNINNPLTALVMALQAEAMYNRQQSMDNGQQTLDDVLDICDEAMRLFPNSIGAKQCNSIRSEILEKELSISMQNVNVPNKAIPLALTYRNITNPHYRIYKVYQKELEELKGDSDVEIVMSLLEKNYIIENHIDIPEEKDYKEHSSLIALPELESGYYFILFSKDDVFNAKKYPAVHAFQVSDLSYVVTNHNGNSVIQVLDRENGNPIKDVMVEAYDSKYDYKEMTYINNHVFSKITDKNGRISIPNDINKSININLYYKNDTLLSESYSIFHFPQKNEDEKMIEKTSFFTDRLIYRPGQTVFFKGIMTNENSKKKELLLGKETEVSFIDSNREVIETKTFVTNEFGSFDGSFVIPDNLSNGSFIIKNESGCIYIKIEEYKRPTFEITFNSLNKLFKLNDKINLTGSVKAYAGFGLDNINYDYTVVRRAYFPYRFWWRDNYNSYEKQIAYGDGTTDSNGDFNIDFELLADDDLKNKLPVFEYIVTVNATNAQGETQTKTYTINASENDLILDFDNESSNIAYDNLESITFSVKNIENIPVKAKVIRKIYQLNNNNRFIDNEYNFDRKLLSDNELKELFPHFDYYSSNSQQSNINGNLIYEDEILVDGKAKVFPDVKKLIKEGRFYVEIISFENENEKITKEINIIDFNSKKIPYKEMCLSYTDKNTAKIGDNVNFYLGSSANDVSVYVNVLHNDKVRYSKCVKLNDEILKFPYKIKKEDRGRITFEAYFVKYNTINVVRQNVSVPYDNLDLDIKLDVERDELQPGANEKWSLTIKDYKDKGVLANLMVGMYDASLDVFAKNKWSLNNKPYIRYLPNNPLFDYGFSHFYTYARKESFPQYNSLDFNILSNYTLVGNNYDGRMYSFRNMSFSNDNVRAGGSLTKSSNVTFVGEIDIVEEDTDLVEHEDQDVTSSLRENFNETAFFYPNLITNEDGSLTFSFTMPDALTRWNLMMLAYTKDLKVGTLNRTFTTSKPLMIMSDMPRFVYENDTLWVVANVIRNSGNQEFRNSGESAIAKLEIFDALTMEPLDLILSEQEIAIDEIAAGNSKSVRWKVALGNRINTNLLAMRFSVSSENFSDAEQHLLPVLSNEVFMTETYPLIVKADSDTTYLFDFQNENERNQGLTLNVCANPVWYAIQSLPYLAQETGQYADVAFNIFYANSLASYIANNIPDLLNYIKKWELETADALMSALRKDENLKAIMLQETPWVMEAKSEAEQMSMLANLFDLNALRNKTDEALKLIKEKQSVNGGWSWFPNMPESAFITQYILEGFGRLYKMDVINSLTANQQEYSDIISKNAIEYLCNDIIKNYDLYKDYKNISHLNINELYALSFFDFDEDSKYNNAKDFYIKQMNEDWRDFNFGTQAKIALILYREGDKDIAQLIMKSLEERAKKNETLGMYWTSKVSEHVVIMEVFNEINPDEQLLNEMKVWLLNNKRTNMWENAQSTVDAVYALFWDKTTGPQDYKTTSVEVMRHGNTGLVIDIKNDNNSSDFMNQYYWDSESMKDIKEIKIVNKSDNLIWGGLFRQYFVSLDEVRKHESPLNVEREIYVERINENGTCLVPIENEDIKVGDKIVVNLNVESFQDMEFVFLKDMRAACLEPVEQISRYKYQDGMLYYQSNSDTFMGFYFDKLPKGKHQLSYSMFVTKEGDFSNGYALIQCMYSPEFSAYSEGMRIKVGM